MSFEGLIWPFLHGNSDALLPMVAVAARRSGISLPVLVAAAAAVRR
jgi:hypothetical protein